MTLPGDAESEAIPPARPEKPGRGSPFEILLALGWLFVPLVQYTGTLERTRWQVGEKNQASLFWATLDLTPFYALLLIATVGLATLRALRGRSARP